MRLKRAPAANPRAISQHAGTCSPRSTPIERHDAAFAIECDELFKPGHPDITATTSTPSSDEVAAGGPMFKNTTRMPSSEGERLSHNKGTSLPSTARHDPRNQQERHDPEFLTSPTTSSLEGPYVSTTDEEDLTSVLRSTASSSNSSFNYSASAPNMSLTRRRSHRTEPRTAPTPSALPALADADIDEDEWDYSETEWWGWVILAATWIVFVVVMGSCFGVWSWAWDVGETPYAPPDLEDDDTLPITGYYPALMVCTAVMSWVWVVVAWVGMVSRLDLNYVRDITNCRKKYFVHSKVVADDG